MDNWFKWLVSVVCGAVATVNRVRVSGYRV